jgi:dTDP-4-amino-4,6-dideoxygalactose transaminase
LGGTERLDTLPALVLTEKLRRLPEEEARRRVAGSYREELGGLGLELPHWAPQLLSLPMYPSLRREEVSRVAGALQEALSIG